jgi:O-antigen/teichoic acid export membrane protein
LIFIPIYGFIAAAWATLAVYVFLAVANYIWGQKYYPVPYNLKKIGSMIVWSLAIYALAEVLKSRDFVHPYIVNAALLLIFAGGLYKIQTQLKTISTNVD